MQPVVYSMPISGSFPSECHSGIWKMLVGYHFHSGWFKHILSRTEDEKELGRAKKLCVVVSMLAFCTGDPGFKFSSQHKFKVVILSYILKMEVLSQ